MTQTTAPRPTRRQIPISADCQLGTAEDWPRAHQRCRGNGPLMISPFTAPVLPAVPCGCPCHTPGGDAQ